VDVTNQGASDYAAGLVDRFRSYLSDKATLNAQSQQWFLGDFAHSGIFGDR